MQADTFGAFQQAQMEETDLKDDILRCFLSWKRNYESFQSSLIDVEVIARPFYNQYKGSRGLEKHQDHSWRLLSGYGLFCKGFGASLVTALGIFWQ